MSSKEWIKRILSKIIAPLGLIWVYLPLIGGIITPMIYMIPLLYTSWYLFGMGNMYSLIWFNGWILLGFHEGLLAATIIVIILESLVFVLGCYLIVSGIVHLASGRKEGMSLIESGPYKFIRHPQHLGIILISLPFALYIPWSNDLGIRIGEILSWSLSCVILFIISEIEEVRITQKLKEEYLNYKQRTGFILPKIRRNEEIKDIVFIEKTKKEVILESARMILIYLIGFALFFALLFVFVHYFFINYLVFTR